LVSKDRREFRQWLAEFLENEESRSAALAFPLPGSRTRDRSEMEV
jgi:hypothetical protein